jgi:hypothetical protein
VMTDRADLLRDILTQREPVAAWRLRHERLR